MATYNEHQAELLTIRAGLGAAEMGWRGAGYASPEAAATWAGE